MDKAKAVTIAKKYINFLMLKGYEIKQVFVFGSCARGTASDDSDIDIAIVLENINSNCDEMIKMFQFRREVDLRIEPHPFKAADFIKGNPFVSEILKTGIRIL